MNQRRRAVLEQVRKSEDPVGVGELADSLGVHPNTVRFHLRTLVEEGRIERVLSEPEGPGRPTTKFRGVRGMDPGGTRHYEALAKVLVAGLAATPDPAGRATEAGRHWGRELAASPPPGASATRSSAGLSSRSGSVRRLVDLLDGLGFAPERSGRSARPVIGLHHCPFLELAIDDPQVVCSIHRGLMEGALTHWGSELSVSSLEAFAEPGRCLAKLERSVPPR